MDSIIEIDISKQDFVIAILTDNKPIIKKFTQKLLAKEKSTKVSMVAIMRKLVYIAFGVIKNNSQFNPNLILDS